MGFVWSLYHMFVINPMKLITLSTAVDLWELNQIQPRYIPSEDDQHMGTRLKPARGDIAWQNN